MSTEMVGEGDRNDFWREITKPLFEASPLPDDRGRPLEGLVRSRSFGSLVVASTTFGPQRQSRDRRTILQSGVEHYLVQIMISGTLKGDFNGTDVFAAPGDIYIQDLAQTLKRDVEAGSRIIFHVPRLQLEQAAGSRRLHGAVFRADWPITQLIIAYLKGLYSLRAPLSEMQAAAAREAVIALLAAALKGDMPDEIVDHSPLGAALRQRVLGFIEQNINLPELSPEFIARRFNVSRSHLYRVLARDGGVATVLRDRRLDRAFVELTRPTASPRTIAELAYSLGFSSGNQFLRAFRARFGTAPSEARDQSRASLASHQPGPDLQSYLADLRDRRS